MDPYEMNEGWTLWSAAGRVWLRGVSLGGIVTLSQVGSAEHGLLGYCVGLLAGVVHGACLGELGALMPCTTAAGHCYLREAYGRRLGRFFAYIYSFCSAHILTPFGAAVLLQIALNAQAFYVTAAMVLLSLIVPTGSNAVVVFEAILLCCVLSMVGMAVWERFWTDPQLALFGLSPGFGGAAANGVNHSGDTPVRAVPGVVLKGWRGGASGVAAVLSAASLGVYDMRFVGELGRFAPDVHNEPASLGSSASLDRLERLIAGRSSPPVLHSWRVASGYVYCAVLTALCLALKMKAMLMFFPNVSPASAVVPVEYIISLCVCVVAVDMLKEGVVADGGRAEEGYTGLCFGMSGVARLVLCAVVAGVVAVLCVGPFLVLLCASVLILSDVLPTLGVVAFRRREPDSARPYHVCAYPATSLITSAVLICVLLAQPSSLSSTRPVLEAATVCYFVAAVGYLCFARGRGYWPLGNPRRSQEWGRHDAHDRLNGCALAPGLAPYTEIP